MNPHLSSEAIQTLVNHLPDYLKIALPEKSAELDCPIEAAIEMAFTECLLKRIASI